MQNDELQMLGFMLRSDADDIACAAESLPIPVEFIQDRMRRAARLLDVFESVQTRINPNAIAAVIRAVDGNHDKGAGELGEMIAAMILGRTSEKTTSENLEF